MGEGFAQRRAAPQRRITSALVQCKYCIANKYLRLFTMAGGIYYTGKALCDRGKHT